MVGVGVAMLVLVMLVLVVCVLVRVLVLVRMGVVHGLRMRVGVGVGVRRLLHHVVVVLRLRGDVGVHDLLDRDLDDALVLHRDGDHLLDDLLHDLRDRYPDRDLHVLHNFNGPLDDALDRHGDDLLDDAVHRLLNRVGLGNLNDSLLDNRVRLWNGALHNLGANDRTLHNAVTVTHNGVVTSRDMLNMNHRLVAMLNNILVMVNRVVIIMMVVNVMMMIGHLMADVVWIGIR